MWQLYARCGRVIAKAVKIVSSIFFFNFCFFFCFFLGLVEWFLIFHVLYVDVMWCNIHKYLVPLVSSRCIANFIFIIRFLLLQKKILFFIFMIFLFFCFKVLDIYINFFWLFIIVLFCVKLWLFFISILNFSLELMA